MCRLLFLLFLATDALIGGCHRTQTPKGRLISVPASRRGQVEEAFRPRKLAMVIGINRFDEHRAWHDLQFAEKDATDLADFLRSKEGGRFDDVTILADPAITDRKSILASLRKLEKKNQSPRDTVLLYFSTHGTLTHDQDGQLGRFVVVQDTREDAIEKTAIAVDDLIDRANRMPSQRKVMILAFCHSGKGKSHLNETVMGELRKTKGSFFAQPAEVKSEASVLLSAASWGETAQEDARLKNDIYTHFFLEALRTRYDLDRNGAVTVSEAHEYATKNTYAYTRGRQRPTAVSDILGADPIVLAGEITSDGSPVIFSYHPSLEGVRIRVNGEERGTLPGIISLPAGVIRLTLSRAKGGPIHTSTIQASPGLRLAAEEILWAPAPFELGLALGAAVLSDRSGDALFAPVMPQMDLRLAIKKLLGPVDGVLTLSAFGHWRGATLSGGEGLDQRVLGLGLQLGAAYPFDLVEGLSAGMSAGLIYVRRDFTRSLQPGESGAPVSGDEQALGPVMTARLSYVLDLEPRWFLRAGLDGTYFLLPQVEGYRHGFLVTFLLGGGVRF